MKIISVSRSDLKLLITDTENGETRKVNLPFTFSVGGVCPNGEGGVHIITHGDVYELSASNLSQNKIDIKPAIKFNHMQCHQVKCVDETMYYADTNDSSIKDIDGNVVYKPSHLNGDEPMDYIHLNGFEPHDGGYFVTAMAYNSFWKDDFNNGRLWHTSDEETYAEVLLPHSPVVYEDKVYVIESGTSSLLRFNLDMTNKEVISNHFKGFVRGLVIHDGYAYVATSNIREKSSFVDFMKGQNAFNGSECAIWKVDLNDHSREKLHTSGVLTEISDICLIDG